jgi:transposase
MRSNRKYDSEFKREAVLLVVEQGLSIREAESNLGILRRQVNGV